MMTIMTHAKPSTSSCVYVLLVMQCSCRGKVIKLARSSLIKVAHICANRGIPVKMDVDRCASRSGIPTRLDINGEGKYPAATEKR
jgi:hypothetical protein